MYCVVHRTFRVQILPEVHLLELIFCLELSLGIATCILLCLASLTEFICIVHAPIHVHVHQHFHTGYMYMYMHVWCSWGVT